jgi:hypothetical protein
MFIALSYGMSLLVVARAIYRISGGLVYPAVSSRLPNGRQMLTY